MTTKYYRLGKLLEGQQLFDNGIAQNAFEGYMHVRQALKEAREGWKPVEEYLNADTMYSEHSLRGVGFQFREQPSEEIDAIFCKGNRYNGYVSRALRKRAPNKALRELHSKVAGMIDAASEVEGQGEFFRNEYCLWMVTGWNLFELMFSGRLSLFPGADQESVYFAASVVPKNVEFVEVTGTEFEEARAAFKEQQADD